jgi:hypothetical protein
MCIQPQKCNVNIYISPPVSIPNHMLGQSLYTSFLAQQSPCPRALVFSHPYTQFSIIKAVALREIFLEIAYSHSLLSGTFTNGTYLQSSQSCVYHLCLYTLQKVKFYFSTRFRSDLFLQVGENMLFGSLDSLYTTNWRCSNKCTRLTYKSEKLS